MARPRVKVGNIEQVSGEVNIAGGDIYEGFTASEVSILITQIKTSFQTKPFDGRCPYKGLAVFEEVDAELFFGRERIVADLVSRVKALEKASRAIFVTGPSGSGKSSIVRAGLIPSLKQTHKDDWLFASMKPGRNPINELALVASRLANSTNAEDEVRTKAMEDETIFSRWCDIALKDGKERRIVLFIDQFEEIFTQSARENERTKFLDMVTHAASIENGRAILVFAMRSDFISNCAAYPKLNTLLNQQFVQIGAMQPDELVNAIAQPALRVGLQTEPALVAQIINDMEGEPGALPLMQFVLKELFESENANNSLVSMKLSNYLERGGIWKALEHHADDSFTKLSGQEQELARDIFSRLIEVGRGTQDTRRTALFSELTSGKTTEEDVKRIVEKLADARLIITDEQAGRDTVTISHEKLIDAWPWLKKLVDENRDFIALQNEIERDSTDWDTHQRDSSYLYSGVRLAMAREKIKDLVLSENADAFLHASINNEESVRLQREKQRRNITTGLISFSAIILGLLVFSLIQLGISRDQQLGAQAQTAFAEQNYNIALLYAYQSNLSHKNNAADLVINQLAYKNFSGGRGLNKHTDFVNSVDWSADGQLASGSNDRTVIIWRTGSDQPDQILEGHTAPVASVAWSTEKKLASGSWDNTVIIWDINTGEPSQVLEGHEDYVNSVAWSPDGRLASGSDDATIIIWDLDSGEPAQHLEGHSEYVTSVAWSDEAELASGAVDDTVIIWDIDQGQPSQILEGHESDVTSVAWSRDGKLASGSWSGIIIIWDLDSGQPGQILEGHTAPVKSLDWSADGRLVSGSDDNTLILWDTDTGTPAQVLKGHLSDVTSVSWSTAGQLASGSGDNTIIIWDLAPYPSAQNLEGHDDDVTSVAWSANGQLASGSDDGTVILWDTRRGEPLQVYKEHSDAVSGVVWSENGRLASGSWDNSVMVWDLDSGQPDTILEGHESDVTSVAWSVDGQLASGSDDGTIIIWDLSNEEPGKILEGHTDSVASLSWSEDGKLASGSWDNTVILWDLQTGQPSQILEGHTDFVNSVAWSASGQLASGSDDKTIIIWDLATNHPAQTLQGHTSFVTSVAWFTNGQLASGSDDNTIILWDLDKGRPAQTLKGHTNSVLSIAWSGTGQLASGSGDKTIKITRANLIINPCSNIIRNMTMQEWLTYQGTFYIYKPACPNLYNPTSDINLLDAKNMPAILITWKGRSIASIFLIIILAIIILAMRVIVRWMGLLMSKAKIHIVHQSQRRET